MNQLSRREFFQFLASPITRTIRRVEARDTRAQGLEVTRADARAGRECARCYARFEPAADELFCPACANLQAQQQALIAEFFK